MALALAVTDFFECKTINDFVFHNGDESKKNVLERLLNGISEAKPYLEVPLCIVGEYRSGKKSLVNIILNRIQSQVNEMDLLHKSYGNDSLIQTLIIDASKSKNGLGSMDVMRNEVSEFCREYASDVNLVNGATLRKKFVIIYDIDKVSNAAQKSLLSIVESTNTNFIVTCSNIAVLPDALKSRFKMISLQRVCGSMAYKHFTSKILYFDEHLFQQILQILSIKNNYDNVSEMFSLFLANIKSRSESLSITEMIRLFERLVFSCNNFEKFLSQLQEGVPKKNNVTSSIVTLLSNVCQHDVDEKSRKESLKMLMCQVDDLLLTCAQCGHNDFEKIMSMYTKFTSLVLTMFNNSVNITASTAGIDDYDNQIGNDIFLESQSTMTALQQFLASLRVGGVGQ